MFLDGRYLITTEIDTVDNADFDYEEENPFNEQRVAMSYPKENWVWAQVPGIKNTPLYRSRKVESFTTPWAILEDVFVFDLYLFGIDGDVFMSIYYAKGLGWVGTTLTDDANTQFVCNYKKVRDEVYGELLPAKDMVVYKQVLKEANFKREEIFKYNITGSKKDLNALEEK